MYFLTSVIFFCSFRCVLLSEPFLAISVPTICVYTCVYICICMCACTCSGQRLVQVLTCYDSHPTGHDHIYLQERQPLSKTAIHPGLVHRCVSESLRVRMKEGESWSLSFKSFKEAYREISPRFLHAEVEETRIQRYKWTTHL